MDLTNYSKQLMQQLWALRTEGKFCDCTILVGDTPHSAHKLVLGATSMLFRYLPTSTVLMVCNEINDQSIEVY